MSQNNITHINAKNCNQYRLQNAGALAYPWIFYFFFSQVQCELSLRNWVLLDGPKQNTVAEIQALEWWIQRGNSLLCSEKKNKINNNKSCH